MVCTCLLSCVTWLWQNIVIFSSVEAGSSFFIAYICLDMFFFSS